MKFLQIDGWGLFFRLVAEDACRAFEELVFPLLDLVGMNIELLGKFGEGLFTANGGESYLRFESRTVVPAGSSGHGSSPVLGKVADLQAEISPNHAVQISRATSQNSDEWHAGKWGNSALMPDIYPAFIESKPRVARK
jgi:hypothetical protein